MPRHSPSDGPATGSLRRDGTPHRNVDLGSETQLTCHFENYLARRAAMPISPQRRTLGDLAVRRTVRVDRR
jgi:hypothetical protein